MGWKVITPPSAEQISLESARDHLHFTTFGSPPVSPHDDWLTNEGIPGARGYCEDWLGRALVPQVIEIALDKFTSTTPGGSTRTEIELPVAPVLSVASVTYVDTAGDEQTMDEDLYVLDDYQEPSWLLPAYGTSWPSTLGVINAVKIRLNVGYSLPTDTPILKLLPSALRSAMLVVLGFLDKNRDVDVKLEDMPAAVQSLIRRHQLRLSMA